MRGRRREGREEGLRDYRRGSGKVMKYMLLEKGEGVGDKGEVEKGEERGRLKEEERGCH